jgi:hypothetical protein
MPRTDATQALVRRALKGEERRLRELDAERAEVQARVRKLQAVLGVSPLGNGEDALYEQVVAFIRQQNGETKIAKIHQAFPERKPKAIRKALSRASAKGLVVRVKGKRGAYLPAGKQLAKGERQIRFR